jgi:CRP-like cAMP-binding protein
MATIASLIDRSDLFGVLPAEERERFAQHFVAITIEKGDTLIREGETPSAVFLIASGVVEVARTTISTPHILARLGPGDGIGLIGLFTDKPHPATGTAITAVEAYRLDKTALASALTVCPNMAQGLKDLALRRERLLLQDVMQHDSGEQEHARMFLGRIRQALHRLAA